MIVENGEFYEDAKGEKQGPMYPIGEKWTCKRSLDTFNSDGTSRGGYDSDLIRKWVEPDTLENLGAKPGDVVGWKGREFIAFEEPKPAHAAHVWAGTEQDSKAGSIGWIDADTRGCRIVSRAADTPPIFEDMTDADKGALLLADHRGKRIECWTGTEWIKKAHGGFGNVCSYRIAPTRIHGSVETDADGSPDFSTWEADQ